MVAEGENMEPDLSEFEAMRSSGNPCGVVRVLEKLDRKQAEKLRAALDRKDLPSTVIVKVLKSWGQQLGTDSVNRHRRGVCRCG